MIDKPTPIQGQDHDRRTAAAMDMIRDSIQLTQAVCDLEPIEMTAVVAQVLGEGVACIDAKREVDYRYIREKHGADLYKETALVNFDYMYNEHRAYHERSECRVKPKPKIV